MRNVLITCLVIAAFSGVANAANPVALLSVATDRPTVTTLGVQVLISDDDNLNATATVRYRVQGDASWRSGPALHRVRPDLVAGRTVPAQFAGSIFDLAPDTAYELEIHLVDPDGPVDVTQSVTSRTRAVPADPATPRVVNVSDAASLTTALGTAQPGDVITLGAGTYAGTFSITSSASTSNPIVIRGVDRDSVILDGQGCTGCNILEVYGSNVHLERLTLRNAERAVRFQSASATGNVMRRVRITDVTLGIGGKPDQTDFYICDNVVEGRLAWPLTYGDDGAAIDR